MGMMGPEVHGSAAEMVFLAALLGADQVLGVQDPFHGWLAEEVDAAWQQARESLAAHGYLAPRPDGSVVLDTMVGALVSTWTWPRASFVVSATRVGAEPLAVYFHVGDHLAVEQHRSGEGCCLAALADAEAVLERMFRLCGLAGQAAAAGGPVTMPESDLHRAREAAEKDGPQAALPVLERPGVRQEDALALAASLAEPLANAALVGLARRGSSWEVAGLALLEAPNGLWRLRAFAREGSDWVEAIPCDAAAAAQEIRRLFNRLLPTELVVR